VLHPETHGDDKYMTVESESPLTNSSVVLLVATGFCSDVDGMATADD
jgi:hypothetical protein